ncbi:MAG TPA: aldo/keto reductase [Alphaproteobacteria bacterium]|nr:aldo/keto reductase [Alphaproteobacteria bacterium]
MRYRLHGKSGLRVSELCLGAMTFGEDWGWGANRDESRAMFDAFAEAGGNFIDTAHVYTEGASERLVGEFVRADRDHFVVATKYTPHTGTDISKSGNSRKNMRHCVEDSLRRLGTDYIDLYLLHFWDYTTPVEEIMRGLDDLVRAGKVLYVAVSDVPAWQIARANMLADLRGWSPFIGMQVEYSLTERTAERELIPMAEELDMGVTAWSPLAQGVLTGKFLDPGANEATRMQREHIPARSLEIARQVVGIAREIGRTPAQVALAAIRQLRPEAGIIPIIAGRSAAQVNDNLGCLDLTLDPAHLKALDEATAIEQGFPYAMYGQQFIKDMAFGRGNAELLDNHRLRRIGRK